MNFLDGGTTLGSGSVSTSNVSALQSDGADDGVSTNLALDPAACPDVTLWRLGCKSTVGPTTRAGLPTWRAVSTARTAATGGASAITTTAIGTCRSGNCSWDTGVAAAVGGWHQVSVVFSSDNVQFYYDGRLAASYGSGEAWGSYGGTSSARMMGYDAYQGGCQWIDAAISEVNVWTTPLGPDDESRLDNSGVVLQSDDVDDYPESGYMAAGWHFNGSLADFTGNGYDGTFIGGDPTWTNGPAFATASFMTYSLPPAIIRSPRSSCPMATPITARALQIQSMRQSRRHRRQRQSRRTFPPRLSANW